MAFFLLRKLTYHRFSDYFSPTCRGLLCLHGSTLLQGTAKDAPSVLEGFWVEKNRKKRKKKRLYKSKIRFFINLNLSMAVLNHFLKLRVKWG